MRIVAAMMSLAIALTAGASRAETVDQVVQVATQAFLAANPQAAGMAIGVVRDGRTYFYNYGLADRKRGLPITSDTLFPIASVTKTFTGTLLADAQIDGKLKLDDDIRHYLDGDYPNLESDGRAIHLADLVDHRSGLPFFIPQLPAAQADFKSDTPWLARVNALERGYSRADFYADLHKVRLAGKPGEIVHYSNAGAMLAGYILERIYRKPYETLVDERILKPLGMTATAISLTSRQRRYLAVGYNGDGVVMPSDDAVLQGAGGLKSSTRDMVKYVAWEMDETQAPVSVSHQAQATSGNYAAGLNWQMLTNGGHRVIWQTGNIDGFHSYCIIEPELKVGLVVLFNEADAKSNPAHGEMVNMILKGLDAQAVLLP
jgi:CubicO group peptidase (beta-lactamase class C family)